MRYILFHADRIAYRALRKALKRPPDPPSEYEAGPAVVVFVTVESGDDERVVERAARDIVEYASRTVKEGRIVLYPYAHLSSRLEKPMRAHSLLRMLEERVRSLFQGEVHRAPFGWYKEFELKVKGHPLSELSRTIEPEPPARIGELVLEGPDQAVRHGLIPEGAAATLRLEGLAAEKARLLGLECGGPESLHYMEAVARAAEKLYGASPARIVRIPGARSLWEIIRSYGEALQAAPALGLAECPLESVVSLLGGADLEELAGAAGIGGGLEWSRSEPPRTLLYRAENSPPVPLGLDTGSQAVIGPIGNIVAAAIHYQAQRVDRGETPVLPAWLHPVTATVIPTGPDTLDYARSVATELAHRGAHVLLLEPTIGLGARIRWSGKRWIPYVIVAGEREMRTGTVTVRRRWRPGEQEAVPLPELAEEVGRQLQAYGAAGTVRSLDIRKA